MNLSKKQKQIHKHREQTCGCQGGRQEGERWSRSLGISRCKLLYVGWISNKVLLQSMGNYIQYPVVNDNGKEYKKRMSVCVRAESLCTAEIGITMQISYISIKINKICPPNSHITATEAQQALRRPGVLRVDQELCFVLFLK